jgi:hypothetical protein
VFVDETGASMAMDRTSGRWKVVMLTAAVRLGVGACLDFDAATDSAAFEF